MTWPRLLGSVPTLKDINLLCWLLLTATAAFLFVAHSGREQVRNADFVQIYSVGRILNEYPAEELYNYQLQQKFSRELHPLKEGFYGPSPYPPYVAVFFRPFARMSYLLAYVLWMSISIALYLAGLAIATRRFFRKDLLRRSLLFCFALAFYPFIVGTLINGQLAAIGFFSLALSINEEDRNRPFSSGLALSLCAYKPTLLVLILPMLFVTKRFRTLAGFGTGTLALILFATAVEGVHVWSGYLKLLFYFTAIHSSLRLPVYIDLRAFTSLLSPRHSWMALIAVWGSGGCAVVCLFRIWTGSVRAGRTADSLVWATTITWTLLLNVYVPVYDSILLVLSIVITATVLKGLPGRLFAAFCVLIFGIVWITVEIAEQTGIQLLTILITALGVLQIYAYYREIDTNTHRRFFGSPNTQRKAAAFSSVGEEYQQIVIKKQYN
jgi:hypothetical protein